MLSPEETALGPGIPVSLSHTLKEHRQTDVVPVTGEVQTEVVTGRHVSDDFHVTVTLERPVTFCHDAVAINIHEAEVTGISFKHLPILEKVVGGSVFRFCVAGIESCSPESPYLANFHAFVIGGQVTRLVEVFGNPAPA